MTNIICVAVFFFIMTIRPAPAHAHCCETYLCEGADGVNGEIIELDTVKNYVLRLKNGKLKPVRVAPYERWMLIRGRGDDGYTQECHEGANPLS